MSHLQIRSGQGRPASRDAVFLRELNTALADTALSNLPKPVFAVESISEADEAAINIASNNLFQVMDQVSQRLNFNTGLSKLQGSAVVAAETAGVAGGLAAQAGQSFVGRDLTFAVAATENVFPVPAHGVPDYLGKRASKLVQVAEAFDNRETRSAVLYTAAYNYTLARQDEFGETIWPTLTLPADQVGFGIIVNRLTVYRGYTHGTDGKAANFKKIDLMRAARNPKVLQKEKTRVYPVVRPNNLEHFVDPALVAAYDKDVEGNVIHTAPYAMNVDNDILGLSQTDASLAGGSYNQTDTLDRMLNLEVVYLKVGADVLPVKVYNHPGSNFTYAPQGMDKQANLTFSTKAILLDKNTLGVGSAPLVDLAVLAAKNLTATIGFSAFGVANTEFGNVTVQSAVANLISVSDADGNVLPATNADVQDLQALFKSSLTVGYDLRAWRTNINMRDRGDLIDRSSFTQLYEIPLLSPVTAQRPQSTDGQLDAGDFEALVTTTRFRLMNDGVTSLLEAFDQIKEYAAPFTANPKLLETADRPSFLGAARFHVQPTVFESDGPIDISKVVDSLNSTDRVRDLSAAFVNIVRDYAFRMYVQSEYPAAQHALGMTDTTTVIIATDPIIHRYIMTDGDLRTLTEKFDVKVVSSIDERMTGKMFITFGVFDENRNQAPNILNFGNLIWAPEVVMSASVPRGESMSRETIVQPRYRFIWHLPVITKLEFINIPDLFGTKLPINFHTV